MELHEWFILLMLGALLVLGIGKLLIRMFFQAKRRHQRQLMRDLMKGDTIS